MVAMLVERGSELAIYGQGTDAALTGRVRKKIMGIVDNQGFLNNRGGNTGMGRGWVQRCAFYLGVDSGCTGSDIHEMGQKQKEKKGGGTSTSEV